jgi:hypothetical protein
VKKLNERKAVTMSPQPSAEPRKYLVAVIVGAVVGGIVVAVATRALPRIMSQLMEQMMAEMPQRMMDQMRAEGLEPADMCQRMMANFKASQAKEGAPAPDRS